MDGIEDLLDRAVRSDRTAHHRSPNFSPLITGRLNFKMAAEVALPPGAHMNMKRRRDECEVEDHRERKASLEEQRPAAVDACVSSVVLPSLGCIRALAVGADGTVFLCTDSALYALAGEQISMIAGSRSETGLRDGVGSEARFNKPCGLAFYTDGSLLVVDTFNHCLRRVAPNGGIVTTFAGCGVGGFVDGVGTAARFQHPWNVGNSIMKTCLRELFYRNPTVELTDTLDFLQLWTRMVPFTLATMETTASVGSRRPMGWS
jgi:hypothetical protein